MKVDTLKKAISEAERFIEVANRVPIKNDKYNNGAAWIHIEDYNKNNAACRRASMDLTRVLADLRQGR